jgi:hypothetical protein
MAHLPSSSLERAINYDYTHPERHYKGLILSEYESDEINKQRKKQGILDMYCHHPNQELCWSCGWSTYMELASSYGSRVKIMHVRENIGIWSIGSQWLLRDQPNDDTLGNDYMTQEFLRAQPGLTVPLIKEMRSLSGPTDKIHFTLMSRAQGVTLDSIWSTLTPEQKSGYKDQLTDFVRQIRQFTAPTAQKVDGSALDDVLIGYCFRRHPPTCKKMGYTTEEWFESIAEELRRGLSMIHKTENPTTIEAKLQELKDNFPKSEPYVLTHADLNLANIIVKDDKIEAIIDWEMSGYYPWWAERWLSIMGSGGGSTHLFEPLWADLSPEMDKDAFSKQVFLKVAPVRAAWKRAQREIDHPGMTKKLLRPGFCECKPYAGGFNTLSLGQRYEHKLREKKPPAPNLDLEIEKMKLREDLTSGKDN